MGLLDSFLYGICNEVLRGIRNKRDTAKDHKLMEQIKEASERYPRVTEENLRVARLKRVKAKYFLDLSTRNEQFKKEAEKAGMSIEEYKKYCKRCISEYDETFRIYNLTHAENAEY